MPVPKKPRVYCQHDMNVKCCPKCFRWSHTRQHLCPGCGFDFMSVRKPPRDRINRGKGKLGSANGASKLTEQQVREIRRDYVAYHNTGQLAAKYGINRRYVVSIVNGETWGWLKDDA